MFMWRPQAAWRTFSALLTGPSLVVRFAAANGLYSKVRNSWLTLPAPARTSFSTTLWQTLLQCAASDLAGLKAPDSDRSIKFNIVQRLAMCVARISLSFPNGIKSVVAQTTALLTSASPSNAQPLAYLALLILRAIPEESNASDFSIRRHRHVVVESRELLPAIASFVDSAAGADTAPLSLHAVGSQPLLSVAVAAALECLSAWTEVGMLPGALATSYPRVCALVTTALRSSCHDIVGAAADCAVRLLHETSHPPDAARPVFLQQLVTCALRCIVLCWSCRRGV